MQIPSYLTTSRHGLHYFRFPIPSGLHPEGKQSCIRLSLDTRCPREALHIASILGYAGDQLMRQMGINCMDYQMIREVLQEHFKEMLERHKQRLAVHGRLSSLDATAFQNSRDFAVDALRAHDYTIMGNDTQLAGLIDAYALPLKRETRGYTSFRSEFLKAFRDYCTAAIEEDNALENYDFKEGTQAAPNARKPKHKKLSDCIEVYCTEKVRLKQWRKSVARDYRSQFELLLEYLGQDVSLHVSSEVANDVKNMLLRLPSHRTKGVLKNLPLSEQLEAKNAKRIGAVTVNKHLTTYSAFYDWSVKRKETDENNFRALIDNVKKLHAERDTFDLAQTKRIFEAVMDAKQSHHKWGVLIAFYTGARVNEIAQLQVADIVQENGIWCFRFTDDEEQKQRLKNESSRRIIPIHSRLIELGFLDLVKKAGTGRIFPKLSYQPKHGYGRGINRWFNESLLPKLGIKSPSLVFHSIRHTVALQLRNNKVSEATLKDILGHSHVGVTMNIYAKNLDKRVMQEAIETLSYA
jgi:integrase